VHAKSYWRKKLMIEATAQQKRIIKEPGNCVIVASPGSGKTYVLSEKIKNIIPQLHDFRGVIAISYTNKASRELKRRCLKDGLDKKGSFFGTIDSFYISEIICSFGKHLFGIPQNDIQIKEISELGEPLIKIFQTSRNQICENKLEIIGNLYRKGVIILEYVGLIAVYIYDNANACRNYIKAKYSHVMIDEYQDCGEEQHNIFIRLNELGLIAVAVGDINQSIYAFSGKDSKYLFSLTRNEGFKIYPLDYNHRSHLSIINYSTRLLNENSELLECDDIRVLLKKVEGSEYDIAEWLNTAIPQFVRFYNIEKYNEIAILVRSGRTGTMIKDRLQMAYKYYVTTPLDESTNIWSGIFRRVLHLLFDKEQTKYELFEEYLNIDTNKGEIRKLGTFFNKLEKNREELTNNVSDAVECFISIAKVISKNAENTESVNLLKAVISSEEYLKSFKPAQDKEIQIMTLHKSKGLEFDLVFHLDLYEYIFSMYKGDYEQDLHLHYVGITRAKKCCILCTSTKRHNAKLEEKDANCSPFFTLNNVHKLAKKAMY